MRRTHIEAADITVSLRAVIVTVTRKARTRDDQPSDTTPTRTPSTPTPRPAAASPRRPS